MIKTILVDDDYLVRMYLLAAADWNKEGFEIIADVQDGEQALEKIEELRPELVITDISMPVMDGVELIREIRRRQIPCRIIVLSCHDSYTHVKEALKQGADDYILKNEFKNENIHNMLASLKHKIEETREETRQKQLLAQLADLGSNELKKKFLICVAENDYDYNQLQGKSVKYGVQLSLLKTAIIEVKLLEPCRDDEPSELKQGMLKKLLKIFREELGMSLHFELIMKNESEYTVILDGGTISDSSAEKLHEHIKQEFNLPLAMGISDVCIGKDSLKHAYLHAKQALGYSFYQKSAIYHYEPKNSSVPHKMSYHRFYDDVRKLLIASDIEGIIRMAECQISIFEKEITRPEAVIEWVKEMDHILQSDRSLEEYEKINHIDQVRAVIDSWQAGIRCYPNIESKVSNIIVAQAIEYIMKNYGEAISLAAIADHLKINATYLSRIFKQETKMNFTDYLTICRIENAKELLSETNKKIKEISAACGFYDYRYFCKIFKKAEGRSPLDYRRNF
jgi:Response regulator containing CheY-like receiver domain and AraC-type DNA-binding domain